MDNLTESVNKTYEDLKLIAYRVEHIRTDFEIQVKPKSKLETRAKENIIELFKTLLADTMICMESLYSVSTCENEDDLELILDCSDIENNEVIN